MTSLFTALVIALGLSASQGGAHVRILVVGSSQDDLSRQIVAEATHAGFTVERVPELLGGEAAQLRAREALAAVYLTSPDSVRIYVRAVGSHTAYAARLARSPADRESFVVQVVELIRGRLIELELLPAAPEPKAGATTQSAADDGPTPPRARAAEAQTSKPAPASLPPPAAAIAPAGDREVPRSKPDAIRDGVPSLWLSAGVAGTTAFGGLGPTLQTALGLRVQPSPRWSASAFILLPMTENEVSAPEGSADVSVQLYYGELAYSPTPLGARGYLDLGAGAGVVVLPMSAEAVAPHVPHTDQLTAGLFFLHAAAGVRVASWLAIRTSARTGAVAPRPVLEFEDRSVAAWGRAFVVATLDAQLAWPLFD